MNEYAVETRPCGKCVNHKAVVGGSICKRHMSVVTPDMLATFRIDSGTCYEAPSLAETDAWIYRVVINCRDTYYARDEREAWAIIGRQRFGSGHMVYDRDGKMPPDFIPY